MKQRAEKDRISAVLFIVVFLLVVVIVIMVLKTVDDKRAAQNAQEQATINTQDYQPPVQDPNAMVSGDSYVTPNPYAPVNTLPGGNSGSGNSGYTGGNSGSGTGTGTGTYPAQAPTTVPANNPAPAPQQQTPTQQAPATNQQTPAQGGDTTTTDPGAFVPVTVGGSSFESETPTPLNIRADWSATAINETQVEVTVTVYCLHQTLYTGEYNPVNMLLGDQYFSMYGTRIRSDSYDYQETKLAEHVFTIDLAQGESKTMWLNVVYEYGGTYFGVKLDNIECGGNITISRQ